MKDCYWGAEDCRHGHLVNCPVTEFNLSKTDPWAQLEARRATKATAMPPAEPVFMGGSGGAGDNAMGTSGGTGGTAGGAGQVWMLGPGGTWKRATP